jgi:hypothetical protein
MVVIGNKQRFAFELIPVTPTWGIRYAPEMAAWAGTAIWAHGMNLCSHVMPGSSEVREYFYVPLGPVVDWLVRVYPALAYQERAPIFPTTRHLHESAERWFDTRHPSNIAEDDWLDAREDWWSRHFLRAGADGALLPELALVRDDEELVLDWSPPRFHGDDAPSMRWAAGQCSLPWDEGRAVLEELAAMIAAWFRESSVADAYAWVRHESPLRHAEPDISEAIELFTGRPLVGLETLFGTDALDGLLRELSLDPLTRDPAASPHCQILRDLSPTVSQDVGLLLRELGNAATRERPDMLRSWRDARQLARDAARAGESPEEAGQLAASEIRTALSLDGRPIGEVQSTLAQLGLSYEHTTTKGKHDRMMVAVREDGAPVARTLQTLSTEKLWGRRFEACRALGHVLLDPIRAGAIGAASGPFAEATRRQRSGAFAAELLLPESAIASASGHVVDGAADEHAFQRLLEQHGVGARTAAYQLWNRGWLSSPEIRDELIEEYGSAVVG